MTLPQGALFALENGRSAALSGAAPLGLEALEGYGATEAR